MSREHKCTECGAVLKSRSYLQRHVKRHEEGTHVCEVCEARYTSLRALKRHVHKAHPMVRDVGGGYQCLECGAVSSSLHYMLYVHEKVHREGTHECPECGAMFLTHRARQVHIHQVHPQAYRCEECGSEFCHLSAFTSHLEAHRDPELYCSVCGAGYKTYSALVVHLRNRHKTNHPRDLYRYVCGVCGQKFRRHRHLEDHQSLHEEPVVDCPHCGAGFRDHASLGKHTRLVHRSKWVEATRPHACESCGERFRTTHALGVHECLERAGESEI